ncbi:dienelactone hydrolase family protein [Sporolactobacillus nakayamae]|uniref:Alpha/beta hydrolase family protein n=1 Tax=Sporolactobacillus nakayamae TaxID=269670 RepID=A0A1I2V3E4_9BACL|nr:alpha/beta hydrolase [Sporolactobacillus nakayamae]SFG83700.1 Alpha/beta hydrolase family protein [Sporolactobacillus nakayamae]
MTINCACTIEKINSDPFKFTKYMPSKSKNVTLCIYHGWGTTISDFDLKARTLAEQGYEVILPEIIYHDSRQNIGNHFNSRITKEYFWKTIFCSIDEAANFYERFNNDSHKHVLIGSSMGGFIAAEIFARLSGFDGLIIVNGSGSFLLSESIFREQDGR